MEPGSGAKRSRQPDAHVGECVA